MTDKIKRCKLINQHITGRPGQIVMCWGHQFIIQPNGDAIAMIHRDFIKDEVAAGRYVVIEDDKKKTLPKEHKSQFGTEIGNYFGAGSLDKLMQEISKLDITGISEFSKEKFSITLPPSMSKKEMLSEIEALTMGLHDQSEPETQPETEPETESKPKRGRKPKK
jgi:hypothetical protein